MGIKAIAEYLGRSVGYVIERHKTDNLPYMLRGYPGGFNRAWTTKALINNWLVARSRVHAEMLKARKAERDANIKCSRQGKKRELT